MKFRLIFVGIAIIYHYFFSKLAGGRNPQNPAIWLVPRASGFLWSCPLTRAESESLAGALFTSLFVVFEWAKPVIFQHFSSKTCTIISIGQGKVNFVIQTKHLKGESSKWARKTSKVKQNGRLVMSLHPSFLTYAVSTAILLLCTVYSTFFLYL